MCVLRPDDGFTKNKQVPFASSESFVMRTSNLVHAQHLHICSLGEATHCLSWHFKGSLLQKSKGWIMQAMSASCA